MLGLAASQNMADLTFEGLVFSVAALVFVIPLTQVNVL